jgi:hypothetical protein
MSRGILLRRLRAVENRHRPGPSASASEVLAELSIPALEAICDAYKAHGVTDQPPGTNPQLEAEIWAILLQDAATPEVFARWDRLLRGHD